MIIGKAALHYHLPRRCKMPDKIQVMKDTQSDIEELIFLEKHKDVPIEYVKHSPFYATESGFCGLSYNLQWMLVNEEISYNDYTELLKTTEWQNK